MTFALPPLLAAALMCGMLPIILLLASARAALARLGPGKRFASAIALSWLVWAAIGGALVSAGAEPSWQDILSGVLLMLGATVASFILWSLLAWGFTASLLLALARSPEPMTFDAVVAGYTGGGGLRSFLINRLGVLIRLRLARQQGDEIVVMRGAASIDRIARSLRGVFGLS